MRPSARPSEVTDFPGTDATDLCRLAARAAWAVLRRPTSFDAGLVLHDWLKQMTLRHRSPNVRLNLPTLPMLLVTERELSRHILAACPRRTGYTAGTLKRKGMSFLAPQALTIAEDAAWDRLRPFNERVLCSGRPHDFQRAFLGQVRRGFEASVGSMEQVRESMGRAMLGIVFGDGVAPARLVADIRELFGLVQNPVKRGLRGARGRRRVTALYDSLREAWHGANGAATPSLLTLARGAAGSEDVERLLQEGPHWMFTFTGSGDDLLSRGLALIGSRPGALARAREEVASAGPLDDPASIDSLRYLETCLLESARLFPPVRFTIHRAPAGDATLNPRIPPETEILQVFSLTQRDRASDPTADEFRPERWLEDTPRAEAAYPNLFLSGARRCPGRDLILFVCKGAAAHLLHEAGLVVRCAELSSDPLPFSFPAKQLRFEIALRTS
jgi:cytochrome P450